MNENDQEIIDSTIDTEITENQEVEETLQEEPQVDVEDLKKKLATAEAQKEHWRKKAQVQPEVKPKEEQANYSLKDTIALSKVDIDDIDDVVEAAKVLKIPIHQAISHSVVKGLLADKAEKRTTAQVTNVTNARRSTARVSDETLLENASSGKLPESDEEIARLMKLKFTKKQ